MNVQEPKNVRFCNGDVLTSKMEAIGHGCNTRGVMGAGVARAIRRAHPQVFVPYALACNSKTFVPGSVLPVKVNNTLWIINMASQDNPGPYARLEWLGESLDKAFTFVTKEGINGFAIPRIGAGIGGLKWDEVLSKINTVALNHQSVILEVWTL